MNSINKAISLLVPIVERRTPIEDYTDEDLHIILNILQSLSPLKEATDTVGKGKYGGVFPIADIGK
jgi:hypothetical protein